MEKRNSKRIYVGYKGEIIYDGQIYECVIENLSSSGAYVVTPIISNETVFRADGTVELKFEPVPGETITLQCRIKWLEKTLPHGLTNKIGLEILNPSWDQIISFV